MKDKARADKSMRGAMAVGAPDHSFQASEAIESASDSLSGSTEASE